MAHGTCAHCSDGFTGPAYQIYCSPRCKNAGGGKLRRKRNAAKSERKCYGCGTVKDRSQFSGDSSTYCRSCQNGVQAEWDKANPAKRAEYKRRSVARAAAADPDYYRRATLRKFHLSLESFDLLLRSQDGRCAICPTDDPGGRHGMWHVDHDRNCCPKTTSCGRCVRGLLCQNCNLMLGHARDDVARLIAGAAYVERTRQMPPFT